MRFCLFELRISVAVNISVMLRLCILIFSSPEPLGSQGELIVYQWILRPSSTIFKDLLLRNRLANQSKILCGASLGRGNESLYKWSRSHDQDGHHAHIW